MHYYTNRYCKLLPSFQQGCTNLVLTRSIIFLDRQRHIIIVHRPLRLRLRASSYYSQSGRRHSRDGIVQPLLLRIGSGEA
jgi:hypothetical protein